MSAAVEYGAARRKGDATAMCVTGSTPPHCKISMTFAPDEIGLDGTKHLRKKSGRAM